MRAVNLIPEEQRGGGAIGSRSGGAAFLVLGLLAGVALLSLLYGLSHHKLESQRAEAESLTQQAQQVQAQAATLAPYVSFMAMREQRMQAVAQLVASRFDWSSSMGELSRVLPSNVALTSIQGAVGAAVSTSKTLAGSAPDAAGTVASSTPPGAMPTITLSGCAASQSVVAQTLVRLRLISGVSAVTLQSSTTSGSGGAGGSSGGSCPSTDPVFSVQVSFNPLPTPSAVSAAAASSASSAPDSTAGSATASAAYTPAGGVAR
ncbi:MAG TPA: hypothetical protein VGI76_07010 [Solirubrobacteraceae bacterium]|jgi:Tfp pilus assembly protein PilN